jgi:3-deoxy-manno-octulosonate cytidylyltransferase (CMP-KDO synthetase)
MKAAIIIPARYASTRLPGKPLLDAGGKTLIQRVYEQAKKSKRATDVIVATDDERIFNAVNSFGGVAVMTSAAHDSGTARVAEAAAKTNADVIVNLQGDEPEIDPADLDFLIDIQAKGKAFASTLACPFVKDADKGAGSPFDASAVKVILGGEVFKNAYKAVMFTRHLCPWPRKDDGGVADPGKYYLHVGVYAFSPQSLQQFASAPKGVLEPIERLEQLRILEMGESIIAGMIAQATPGIDTEDDYQAYLKRLKSKA